MQYKSQKYPHPVQGLYSPGLNTASFPKQCRKDNQLKQLFQGSFWKNRNFFKGVLSCVVLPHMIPYMIPHLWNTGTRRSGMAVSLLRNIHAVFQTTGAKTQSVR